MLALDKDAVLCDLAETYHLYNYKGLPGRYLAALCVGLRDNSRIKMKMSGSKIPLDITLQILTLDSLNMLRWQLAGGKGKKPISIYNQVTAEYNKQLKGFTSGKDFEDYINKHFRKGE